jgi:hypothetical protein
MISCKDIPLSVSLAVQCPHEVLQLVLVEQQAGQYNSVISESRLHLDVQNCRSAAEIRVRASSGRRTGIGAMSECRSWRERVCVIIIPQYSCQRDLQLTVSVWLSLAHSGLIRMKHVLFLFFLVLLNEISHSCTGSSQSLWLWCDIRGAAFNIRLSALYLSIYGSLK